MTRRLLTAVVLVVLGLGLAASAVGAHASLQSSEPAAGATLETAPDEIVLTFNEPVELDLGGIRVYDSDRELVSDGSEASVTGDGTVARSPLPDLSDGDYVVTWRATSADSHPISGAFSFRVGEGELEAGTAALVDELIDEGGGSATARALYAADRTLVFAGLAGFVGLLAFVVAIAPARFSDRRVRRYLWAAWAVLFVATAVSIGLQGVTAGGLPLRDIVDPSVLEAVSETRFGQMALLRLGLLVVAIALLWAVGRGDRADDDAEAAGPPAWWTVGVALVGLGLFVTVAWAGHAGSGRYIGLAMVLDVAHQSAMAVWLGGLLGLLVLVLPAREPEELQTVVPRFSSVAFGCVVALVVTGTVQAWRQLGSLSALTDTSYGRVLLIKVAIVAGLVALAAVSRAVVRRGLPVATPLPAGPGALVSGDRDADDTATLERSVAFEVVLGVAVLVATAFLVDEPPGLASETGPWSERLPAGEVTVDMTIDPATDGPVTMHTFVLSDAGTPVAVEDLTVSLTLPADDIGPFEVPLEAAGPGHYTISDYDIPFEGDWLLEVEVRLSQFELVKAETTVPIE